MENIIFHASHAGFTHDTHNIHANIEETVNSCMEFHVLLCAEFSCENRVKLRENSLIVTFDMRYIGYNN